MPPRYQVILKGLMPPIALILTPSALPHFVVLLCRYSDKLGFLGTCPSNLGTGLRASVMIKLTKFNETEESREVLEQVIRKGRLSVL